MKRLLPVLALLAATGPGVAVAATIDAVWKRQTIELSYVSLTTAYSCELIEARIKSLLWHLGVAEDIEIAVVPCTGLDRPQTRHRITVTFSTLVPAFGDAADVVEAEWTEVALGKRSPASIDDRDCELLEKFQEQLLPSIEHQVVDGTTGCSADKRSLVGRLRLRVLKPIAKAVAEAGAEAPGL